MKLQHPIGTVKYIVLNAETIELTYCADGLWYDEDGTAYALRKEEGSLDDIDRPGIYPFVMPIKSPLDNGCAVHDYLYECPAYQLFHTRKEADEVMLSLVKQSTRGSVWSVLTYPFYYITRLLGWFAWENNDTNR